MNSIIKSLLVFVLLSAAGFAANDFVKTKKKAEAGDAKAQFELGYIYYNGKGVPKDYAESAKWYRKAADQGDAAAETMLGIMYSVGEGVSKDYAEAVKWYRKAADQGDAATQSILGDMYYNGYGVPKDLVQAHAWFNIAGANGDEGGKKSLASVEKEMTVSQKEKAMDMARELFAKLPKK